MSVSSVCSTSLGLSLPSITGELLQATNWDLFPWALCRSGEQGNAAAFLPYPRPVLPKPHTTAAQGKGAPGSLSGNAGMGWVSRAQCSSQPPSHQPVGKQDPISLEQGCSQCLGGVVPVAPVLLSWLQAHPLCGPFMSRSISHFRAGCLVGVAGREVQGAVLFQL